MHGDAITTMKVDNKTLVKYQGRHRDIRYEISAHNFKTEFDRMFEMPCMWATYILLKEKTYEEVKARLHGAPWNGGITYFRKITEEHIDAPEDLRAKWDGSYYRIGDDYSHLWDYEHYRWQLYDREYLERNIKAVIDYLIDGYLVGGDAQ